MPLHQVASFGCRGTRLGFEDPFLNIKKPMLVCKVSGRKCTHSYIYGTYFRLQSKKSQVVNEPYILDVWRAWIGRLVRRLGRFLPLGLVWETGEIHCVRERNVDLISRYCKWPMRSYGH